MLKSINSLYKTVNKYYKDTKKTVSNSIKYVKSKTNYVVGNAGKLGGLIIGAAGFASGTLEAIVLGQLIGGGITYLSSRIAGDHKREKFYGGDSYRYKSTTIGKFSYLSWFLGSGIGTGYMGAFVLGPLGYWFNRECQKKNGIVDETIDIIKPYYNKVKKPTVATYKFIKQSIKAVKQRINPPQQAQQQTQTQNPRPRALPPGVRAVPRTA